MERQLKQRLLAAIVLLALIVIFVPMLFRKHKQDADIVTINSIPQAPAQADVQQMTSPVASNELITSSNPDAASTASGVSTETAVASEAYPEPTSVVDSLNPEGTATKLPPAQPQVQVPNEPSELYDALSVNKDHAESAKGKKSKPASSQSIMALSQSVLSPHSVKQFHLRGTNVSSSGVENEKLEATPSQQKQLATAKSLAQGFVVQLGYFSSKANAKKLQSDLRSKGYKAFIYNDREGSKTRYRVYVGPMLNKEAAEQEHQKLSKQHINGIVTKYDTTRFH